MSDIHGFVQQDSVARKSDGTVTGIRVTRDGSLIQVPWLQALCLEGRMFGVGYGATNLSASTVGTFGAGGIDLGEFDLLQQIPATVAVLPVYFKVVLETIGTIAAVDILLAWGAGGIPGTDLDLVPYNLRPGSSNVTACTLTGLDDGDGTDITLAGYIYREGTTALTGVAATPAQLIPAYTPMKAGFIPVIEGARQIAGYASAQESAGFITYVWAELPISAIE